MPMMRSSRRHGQTLLALFSLTNTRTSSLSTLSDVIVGSSTLSKSSTTSSRPKQTSVTSSSLQRVSQRSGIVTPPRHGFILPRFMTSAYDGEPSDGTAGLSDLSYIPYETALSNGIQVQVGPFDESEWQAGMDLMNLIIREGKSWPFDGEFETMDAYRGYFMSHAAFVVRTLEPSVDANGKAAPEGTVVGCFYIKPNYPGRCSHICNGGFITNPAFRRMGVAKLMGQVFLRCARDLGYKSAYFNLVFESNTASVALWESLGFQRVAVLENAADLEGVEGLDTAFGYRFDLEKLSDDYLFTI